MKITLLEIDDYTSTLSLIQEISSYPGLNNLRITLFSATNELNERIAKQASIFTNCQPSQPLVAVAPDLKSALEGTNCIIGFGDLAEQRSITELSSLLNPAPVELDRCRRLSQLLAWANHGLAFQRLLDRMNVCAAQDCVVIHEGAASALLTVLAQASPQFRFAGLHIDSDNHREKTLTLADMIYAAATGRTTIVDAYTVACVSSELGEHQAVVKSACHFDGKSLQPLHHFEASAEAAAMQRSEMEVLRGLSATLRTLDVETLYTAMACDPHLAGIDPQTVRALLRNLLQEAKQQGLLWPFSADRLNGRQPLRAWLSQEACYGEDAVLILHAVNETKAPQSLLLRILFAEGYCSSLRGKAFRVDIPAQSAVRREIDVAQRIPREKGAYFFLENLGETEVICGGVIVGSSYPQPSDPAGSQHLENASHACRSEFANYCLQGLFSIESSKWAV